MRSRISCLQPCNNQNIRHRRTQRRQNLPQFCKNHCEVLSIAYKAYASTKVSWAARKYITSRLVLTKPSRMDEKNMSFCSTKRLLTYFLKFAELIAKAVDVNTNNAKILRRLCAAHTHHQAIGGCCIHYEHLNTHDVRKNTREGA